MYVGVTVSYEKNKCAFFFKRRRGSWWVWHTATAKKAIWSSLVFAYLRRYLHYSFKLGPYCASIQVLNLSPDALRLVRDCKDAQYVSGLKVRVQILTEIYQNYKAHLHRCRCQNRKQNGLRVCLYTGCVCYRVGTYLLLLVVSLGIAKTHNMCQYCSILMWNDWWDITLKSGRAKSTPKIKKAHQMKKRVHYFLLKAHSLSNLCI